MLFVLLAKLPRCQQPIAGGWCQEYHPSWAYDPKFGMCVAFIYGGCGGTANRFKTRKQCQKACETNRTKT